MLTYPFIFNTKNISSNKWLSHTEAMTHPLNFQSHATACTLVRTTHDCPSTRSTDIVSSRTSLPETCTLLLASTARPEKAPSPH